MLIPILLPLPSLKSGSKKKSDSFLLSPLGGGARSYWKFSALNSRISSTFHNFSPFRPRYFWFRHPGDAFFPDFTYAVVKVLAEQRTFALATVPESSFFPLLTSWAMHSFRHQLLTLVRGRGWNLAFTPVSWPASAPSPLIQTVYRHHHHQNSSRWFRGSVGWRLADSNR